MNIIYFKLFGKPEYFLISKIINNIITFTRDYDVVH